MWKSRHKFLFTFSLNKLHIYIKMNECISLGLTSNQSVVIAVTHRLIPNTSRKEKSRYTCVGWEVAWSLPLSYRPQQSHLYMPPGWGSTPWPPRLVSLLQHQPISLDKKCLDIHKEEFLKHCMGHHPGSCELHTTKYTPRSIPVPDPESKSNYQGSKNGNI